MKKKVSWWKSRYSDYTHMEEDECCVTLYVKDTIRNNLCCLDYFMGITDGKGKTLRISYRSYVSVVLSVEEYNRIADIWVDYKGIGYL